MKDTIKSAKDFLTLIRSRQKYEEDLQKLEQILTSLREERENSQKENEELRVQIRLSEDRGDALNAQLTETCRKLKESEELPPLPESLLNLTIIYLPSQTNPSLTLPAKNSPTPAALWPMRISKRRSIATRTAISVSTSSGSMGRSANRCVLTTRQCNVWLPWRRTRPSWKQRRLV